MKRVLALCLTMIPSGFVLANVAGAQINRDYDALYTYSDMTGAGTYRLAADGRGHSLTELRRPSLNSLSIVDRTTNTMYTVTTMADGTKTGLKTPCSEKSQAVDTVDDMRKKNATQLGTKVIAGHPCHGFRFCDSKTGSTSDSWIGDDIDFLVKSESNYNGTKTQMTLQSFSDIGPMASTFAIPSDVNFTDMAALSRTDNSKIPTFWCDGHKTFSPPINRGPSGP